MPNPESALNEEAGKMLLERYDDYSSRAKMITEIHAQPTKSANSQHSPSSCAGNNPEDDASEDGGPLSKKSALDKKVQDKKKEKLIKEKKRTMKRL